MKTKAVIKPSNGLGIRGIVSPTVRADQSNEENIATELSKAFAEFKTANDERIAQIENRSSEDALTREKVDRINDSIGTLEASLNELREANDNDKMGGANAPSSPENQAHVTAFNAYFRHGDDSEMGDYSVNNAQRSAPDSDGGFLIPESIESGIQDYARNSTAMRRLARNVNISTNAWNKIYNKGGLTSGWVGEEEDRPETSSLNLGKITIPAMEIYAMPAATQRILDDSELDIAQWLAEEVEEEFSQQEGSAFIVGSGTNQPKGILTPDMVLNADYAWGKIGYTPTGVDGGFQALDAGAGVNPADVLYDVFYSLKQKYRRSATWLMNDLTLGTIRKFKDAQGRYIWTPPNAGEPGTILGKPYDTDDYMPEMALNSCPLAFGDWKRAYTIVDRKGSTVLRDPYTQKPYVLFYITKRVGGGINDYEAYKTLKASAA